MYSGIINITTQFSDIPKISTNLWYSGCRLKCKGCHNSKLEKFQNGLKLNNVISILEQTHDKTDWIVFIGGNPIDNIKSTLKLSKYCKTNLKKNTFLFSGYNLKEIEKLLKPKELQELYSNFDYIKCGRFNKNKLSSELCPGYHFASTNQIVYKIVDNNPIAYYYVINGVPNMKKFKL